MKIKARLQVCVRLSCYKAQNKNGSQKSHGGAALSFQNFWKFHAVKSLATIRSTVWTPWQQLSEGRGGPKRKSPSDQWGWVHQWWGNEKEPWEKLLPWVKERSCQKMSGSRPVFLESKFQTKQNKKTLKERVNPMEMELKRMTWFWKLKSWIGHYETWKGGKDGELQSN